VRASRRLSWADRLRSLATLGLLAAAEIGLRTRPLPTVARWFGVPISTTAATGDTGQMWTELSADERHRLAVTGSVADRWPFGRGPCLRQALVEGWVLRQRHPVLRLGVATAGSAILAHAWVEVDGRSLHEPGGFLPFETTAS
jgi:hypothetical protein